jgi:hypothetical protein
MSDVNAADELEGERLIRIIGIAGLLMLPVLTLAVHLLVISRS